MRASWAVALLVAGSVAGCAGDGDTGPGAGPTAPSSPAGTVTGEQVEVTDSEVVDIGAGPVGIAVGDGAVWVVNATDETVSRIPLGARRPDLVADAPGVPLRATVAYDAVWVSAFEAGRLLRLDPRTGRVTDRIRAGDGPEGVAAGFGAVWVVSQDSGLLLRVDPSSREVVARIDIGSGARLVTTGGGAVWVSHFADGTVLRVDPRSADVTASARLCEGPQGLALTGGLVWTACTFDDRVLGLDPDTLAVVHDVPVTGFPDPLAVAPDGTLLVVPEQGPAVVSVDPATGEVVDERVLGELAALGDRANLDAAVAGDEVWVTSHSVDRVHHLPVG